MSMHSCRHLGIFCFLFAASTSGTVGVCGAVAALSGVRESFSFDPAAAAAAGPVHGGTAGPVVGVVGVVGGVGGPLTGPLKSPDSAASSTSRLGGQTEGLFPQLAEGESTPAQAASITSERGPTRRAESIPSQRTSRKSDLASE